MNMPTAAAAAASARVDLREDQDWQQTLCRWLREGPASWPRALQALGDRFPEDVDDGPRDDVALALAACPTEGGLLRAGIPGYLRRADALALHTLTRDSPGDVLELGPAWGLSSSVICRALSLQGVSRSLLSVECDADRLAAAAANLARAGLAPRCHWLPGLAEHWLTHLARQGRRFGLIFVDHDHREPATRQVCDLAPQLLLPGGQLLFHDFNDARHRSEPEHYGVFGPVCDRLHAGGFELVRVVGCCAQLRWTGGTT